MRAVKEDGGSGECVVAAMTDVDEIKFKKGSTSAPMWTVKKWSDLPDCLTASSEPEQVAATVEADDEF